jgi:hypothetical protein
MGRLIMGKSKLQRQAYSNGNTSIAVEKGLAAIREIAECLTGNNYELHSIKSAHGKPSILLYNQDLIERPNGHPPMVYFAIEGKSIAMTPVDPDKVYDFMDMTGSHTRVEAYDDVASQLEKRIRESVVKSKGGRHYPI